MNKLALVLNFVMTLSTTGLAFATESMPTVNIDQDKVISIVNNSIGEENTCLDEYLTREKQLRNF